MKLATAESRREVESTLDGTHIGVSINPEDMPKILDLLTDLYEDEKMAVLREYSTNALDAHVAAGQTRPIEITLPTQLAPQLRIRDFGVGLSFDDVVNIYSKYGASTKTDSNDFVGALGLGCKSAWTYTDHFTITAVKDGVKITVSASRDEDAGASLEVVDEVETDEPNGVEIMIPIKAEDYRWGSYGFADKAKELFKYWKRGTVLVDGEEPETIWDEENGFWIADDLLITEQGGEDVVVMGGVAYPFPGDYSDYSRRYTITAFVEIGSVEFTPSRESLKTNRVTRAALDNILQRIQDEAGPAVSKQIASAPSRPEAIRLFHESASIFRSQFEIEGKYKGKDIPTEMEAPKTGTKVQEFVVVKATRNKGHREKGWNRMRAYPSSTWHNTLFIRGYDGADFSPYKRKKMDQWLQEKFGDNIPEYQTVVFTSKVPNHHWIDSNRIFPWQEIKDQKIVRENVITRDGRVSGSYEGYVNDSWQHELKAEDIDTNNVVLFLDKTKHYDVDYDQRQIVKDETNNQFTIVQLASNRVGKFQRDFPMAQPLHDYVKKVAKNWSDSLTDDDKLHLKINQVNDYGLKSLKGLTLDDPDLQDAIDKLNSKDGRTKLFKSYEKFSSYVRLDDVEWNNPTHKYPLLQELRLYGTMGSVMQKEVTIYLNAAYAASQEEAS